MTASSEALWERYSTLCVEAYKNEPGGPLATGYLSSLALSRLVSEQVSKAVEEEREACARRADANLHADHDLHDQSHRGGWHRCAQDIAFGIRSRDAAGEKEE